MDSDTTLCLACSSSLPPRLIVRHVAAPSNASDSTKKCPSDCLFFTPCCSRPICPTCLSRNPRLARYDPCLFCLNGVRAVSSSTTTQPKNLDGGVKDSDVFTVGDDEDEDEDGGARSSSSGSPPTPPPSYSTDPCAESQDSASLASLASSPVGPSCTENAADGVRAEESAPATYYLRTGDTLLGISLRFGVDGRTLCRLNNLPQSTLTTTPHILHTRTFITLPPSSRTALLPPPPDPNEDARRARERAQKRFQSVTKEVDWRVARAYVAIAEDGESPSSGTKNCAEKRKTKVREPLESRAVGQYMEDEEWEAEERRAGRGMLIPRFPLTDERVEDSSRTSPFGWWKRD
ncbi:hypothetical protein K488DRAFT_43432 [Vararia minispora EC-137]|uniref:Uncharacterized protein n=1 Tax=Vararia minispora EC-137 TaxID=1314806 RepID=A0ACB8QUQ1_9AGAM|nr:hypothetical protein K488DRAFT_43432 [Vararia minispora EC-137]